MAREMCCRGKRIPHGEWVEGFYGKKGVDEYTKHCIMRSTLVNQGGIYYYFTDSEVDPDTVGEFFGKRDKNGRRIFEGDIGRYRQTDGAKRNGTSILCTGKVVYNTETASYAVESRDEAGCRYFDYFPIKDFEVIGNIYDNPELLKQEVQ